MRRTIMDQRTFAFLSLAVMGMGASMAAAQSQHSAQSEGWAHVDCDKEHAGALQRATDGATSGQTILISGTCYENVAIPIGKDLLTLNGGGNATINGPDTTLNTILVRGPRGITITGLT